MIAALVLVAEVTAITGILGLYLLAQWWSDDLRQLARSHAGRISPAGRRPAPPRP